MTTSHYVAVVFGCLFIVAGVMKLIPLDSDQAGHGHPELQKQFEQFITVLPLREQLGIKTTAMYLSLVGLAETILGTALAFGRAGYRVAAAVPLLVIMAGAFYTLIMVGEPLSHTVPSVVFGLALIYVLLNQRELRSAESKIKSS